MLHVMLSYLFALFFSRSDNYDSPSAPNQRHRSQSRRFHDDRRMRLHLAKCKAPAVIEEVNTNGGMCVPAPLSELHSDSGVCLPTFVEVDPKVLGMDLGDNKSSSADHDVPLVFIPLLRYMYDAAVSADDSFGVFCRAWLIKPCCRTASVSRQRDIFPLPLMVTVEALVAGEVDPILLLNVCNLSILSLNFLWHDFPGKAIPRPSDTCNSAQKRVHAHVLTSVIRMVKRLSSLSAKQRPTLSDRGHPMLDASLVEMGLQACTCDSMAYVSTDLREEISDNGGLFRDVTKHRSAVPRFTGADRSQYTLVTWRGIETGKLRLRTSVEGGGSVFAVTKPSGGQREVWHGRYVSSLAMVPPKPLHQPTPTCLLDLEVSADCPMYFSKRDAVSYFDCLAAPECTRQWFGRPALRLGELLEVVGGLTLESLSKYVDGTTETSLTPATRVYPTACCWPMGFSWSSAVGQSVMLHQTRAAGMTDTCLLADDKPCPDFGSVSECHAVCTDDVMHWARDPAIAKRRLEKLDRQWTTAGISRRPDKDLDWSLKGTALGCDYDGAAGFLDASASKQLQTMYDTLVVLSSRAATPDAVMKTMGSLQWFDLLNRNKLSVYDDVYAFMQLPDPSSCHDLPDNVKAELMVSICLAPFWSADLSRRHLPFLSATDASTSYGFGVSIASADITVVREVSRFAEKRGDYVVLDNDSRKDNGDNIKQRIGRPRRLGMDVADFKTVLCVKAKRPAHNNIMEGEAYLMWLRWLLRSSEHHGVRAVCLVDSKVVLGGVSKGRSSSRPLLRVLRRTAALQLAGNLLVRLLYIPTCCNPADAPSRGVRVRPAVRGIRNKIRDRKLAEKKVRHQERLSKIITNSPYRDELAELVADDQSFWNFKRRRK